MSNAPTGTHYRVGTDLTGVCRYTWSPYSNPLFFTEPVKPGDPSVAGLQF